jgi:hypothetical protein
MSRLLFELEGLWNQLGETVPFSLFCAYPQRLFVDSPEAGAFAEVCHLHSGMVERRQRRQVRRWPGGSPEHLRRPDSSVDSCGRHRSVGAGDDLRDDAALVVAELATNAIVHAGSDVAVRLLVWMTAWESLSVNERAASGPPWV